MKERFPDHPHRNIWERFGLVFGRMMMGSAEMEQRLTDPCQQPVVKELTERQFFKQLAWRDKEEVTLLRTGVPLTSEDIIQMAGEHAPIERTE